MSGILEFISYLESDKRYSKHTVISYRNDLNQFHEFCQNDGTGSMDLSFRAIRNWVVALMEKGYAPRTIHRKLSSLRSYCRYLIKTGQLETNPVEKVLKPKLNKRVPAFVDEKSISELLDRHHFSDDYSGLRNRLIINMLYQTGMRRSELVGLKTDDIDMKTGQLKVTGKRNKERIIPFGNELRDNIREFLEVRGTAFPGVTEQVLLLTDRGRPVYPKLIYRVVDSYLRLVSTVEKTSPHILRHTFATHMLNRGADLNAIKELLGHANLSATQVYTHNTFEKLKSVYNQAHPRA